MKFWKLRCKEGGDWQTRPADRLFFNAGYRPTETLPTPHLIFSFAFSCQAASFISDARFGGVITGAAHKVGPREN